MEKKRKRNKREQPKQNLRQIVFLLILHFTRVWDVQSRSEENIDFNRGIGKTIRFIKFHVFI